MIGQPSATPSKADLKLIGDDLSLADGVEFPSPDSMILSPPPGKVGVYLKTFDTRFHLPLLDIQEEILQKVGCSVQMLTPNVINKVVAFEMICRANGLLSDYFVFKCFFRLCATDNKDTFSVRQGGHTLVPDGKTPKNLQDKWLRVNQSLVGTGRYQANTLADVTPKLFPHNQVLLKGIQVALKEYS